MHVRLAIGGVEQLDQRGEVGAVASHLEHRFAAIAVKRLHDDLFMLGEEFAGEAERAGDRGRRHEAGVIEHPQFLGRIADLGGIVDHQGLALDPLEQMGGGDVGEVERRILAHQHDVDVAAEIDDRRLAELEMGALDPLHRHRPGHRPQPPVRPAQILDRIIKEPMPARLRCEHDREGRIARDIDGLQRIHLDGDGKAHRSRLSEGDEPVTCWKP